MIFFITTLLSSSSYLTKVWCWHTTEPTPDKNLFSVCECKLPYYHIKLTYQWLFQLFLTYYSIAPCTDSSIYLYSYPYILTICTLINFSPFPICIFSRQLACFIKCKFLISSRSIFSFILYYIILYYIIFYYFILNCIILYYVTLC